MAKQSRGQKKTMERVMHEFKHGELKSGPGGKAGKVKSRRQAIAIALNEAGSSKYESKAENERNYRRTKKKEARGQTALAETEGRKSLPDRSRRKTTGRKSTAAKRKPSSRATAAGRKTSTSRTSKRRATKRK